MSYAEVRQWLDEEWEQAMASGDVDPDPDIDALVNSEVVSARYALVTQVLGKIADPSRDLRYVQSGKDIPGAWDARSFSTKVVVRWVHENQNVIGTSAEPYASKPLRRVRLEQDMSDVKNVTDWNRLVALLDRLESAGEVEVKETFRRILKSLVRRLASQDFQYAIPQRISVGRLQTILDEFLSEPSGGLRALVVTVALTKTISEAFSLFSRVEAQGINESDAAGDSPGDVVCFDRDEPSRIALCIEVKDIDLTLTHVRASSLKAKRADVGLSNLLFVAPRISVADSDEIASLVAKEWASGVDIYTTCIRSLVDVLFVMLAETWRVRYVREIGIELDMRQHQPSRKAWHDLLLTNE